MTTNEFRSTPELVAEMRQVFEMPWVKMWLEAIDGTNPARKPAPIGIQQHEALIMLGEQTGWMGYRDTFLLGSVPLEPPPKEEPMTYAEPALEPE